MGLTTQDVHIDTPLSNLVIGFEPDDIIVDQIFPEVQVMKQSDLYWTWGKGDFFRIPDSTLRAEKTKGKRVEFNVSSETYFAKNFALRTEQSFESMANAAKILKTREKDVRALKNLIMLDWENRVASVISSGSNMGSFTTLSGTAQWSDLANSDPINDVLVGKESIRSTTGKSANLIIIPEAVRVKLVQHPDIIDRVKYTGTNDIPGQVTSKALAALFEVDRVLFPKSIKNTGEINQSDVFGDVWGDNVILAYVTNGPDPDGRDPSLGYTFRWNSPELQFLPFTAEIWNDPDGGKFENRRVMTYQDEKLTASELGYVIADTLA